MPSAALGSLFLSLRIALIDFGLLSIASTITDKTYISVADRIGAVVFFASHHLTGLCPVLRYLADWSAVVLRGVLLLLHVKSLGEFLLKKKVPLMEA